MGIIIRKIVDDLQKNKIFSSRPENVTFQWILKETYAFVIFASEK